MKTPRAPPKVRLPIKTNTNQDDNLPPIKRIKLDHTYSSSSVEDALNQTKAAFVQSNRKLLENQKEVKLLKTKVKRKNDKLSALIENLKKDSVLSPDQIDFLNLNFNRATDTQRN